MFVRNHMLIREKLTTVSLGESVGSVLKKIEEGDFLSLPVFQDEEFKGFIMKEAIYRNYFEINKQDKEDYLSNTTVSEIYNDKFKSIYESDRIDEASYLLKELRTPFLPVFDSHERFVGILTHFSIFNAFSEIFGIDKGTRIVVNMFDLPGQLSKLTEVIRKAGINIINLAIVDAKVLDITRVILRVDTKEVNELIEKIQAAGFKIGEAII